MKWLFVLFVIQTAILLFIAAGAIYFHIRMNIIWERSDKLLRTFEKAITDEDDNICVLCGGPMSELERKCAELLKDED